MTEYTQPDFKNSALITIDTQNDFTLDDAPVKINGTLEVIPNMVRLLDVYRATNKPIIHVVRLYLDDGSNSELCRREAIQAGTRIVSPGTTGAELVAQLKPDQTIRLKPDTLLTGQFQKIGPNEFIMYKPRWGAFYMTGLQDFLKELGITTLVFCGCNFPNCPRASIVEASERDYRIVLVTDATSMFDDKDEMDMLNIGVKTYSTTRIYDEISRSKK